MKLKNKILKEVNHNLIKSFCSAAALIKMGVLASLLLTSCGQQSGGSGDWAHENSDHQGSAAHGLPYPIKQIDLKKLQAEIIVILSTNPDPKWDNIKNISDFEKEHYRLTRDTLLPILSEENFYLLQVQNKLKFGLHNLACHKTIDLTEKNHALNSLKKIVLTELLSCFPYEAPAETLPPQTTFPSQELINFLLSNATEKID